MYRNKVMRRAMLAVCASGVIGCAVDSAVDPDPVEHADQTASRHCVVSPTNEVSCFETFTEAISVATHGEIGDAPAQPNDEIDHVRFGDQINAITTRRLATRSQAATSIEAQLQSFTVGILYEHGNFRGRTWVFNRDSPCDGEPRTTEHSVSNLNAPPYDQDGMNDRISSFESFSSCQTVLFEHWKSLGQLYGGFFSVLVPSNMNDRASSIEWR